MLLPSSDVQIDGKIAISWAKYYSLTTSVFLIHLFYVNIFKYSFDIIQFWLYMYVIPLFIKKKKKKLQHCSIFYFINYTNSFENRLNTFKRFLLTLTICTCTFRCRFKINTQRLIFRTFKIQNISYKLQVV